MRAESPYWYERKIKISREQEKTLFEGVECLCGGRFHDLKCTGCGDEIEEVKVSYVYKRMREDEELLSYDYD